MFTFSSFYWANSWTIPACRSSVFPSTLLEICRRLLLFNSRLKTVQNTKHIFIKTEKELARDQRVSFLNCTLWEQETEQKDCKKISHENDVAS